MNIRQVLCSLIAAACCGLLTGCSPQNNNNGQPNPQVAAHTIVFSVISGSSNCQQKLDTSSPSASPITIGWGDTVSFGAVDGNGASTTFSVTFPPGASATCDSPFQTSSCQATIASSAVTSSGGMKFPYQTLTVGGQQCGNPQQLGLIMRP